MKSQNSGRAPHGSGVRKAPNGTRFKRGKNTTNTQAKSTNPAVCLLVPGTK